SALSAVKIFQKNTSKDARRAIALTFNTLTFNPGAKLGFYFAQQSTTRSRFNTQTNPPAQNRGGLFACRVIDGDALQIIKDSYRNAVKSEII
ncbi:MAG TPA: hypothetical protein DCQ51_06280, partial [Planktothrix sp. UBA8407]|nr:hypothetical protein [Planktothrix sp. UBA8407]